DRSGRTLGNCVVQLAETIVPAADEREYRSSMWIKSNQCYLRIGTGLYLRFVLALSYFHFAGPHLGDLLIDQLYSRVDSLRGCLLQVGIERAVDAVGLLVQFPFRILVVELIANQIDKIGRVAGFNVR